MNHTAEIIKSLGTIKKMLNYRGIKSDDLDSFSHDEISNKQMFSIELSDVKIRIYFDISPRSKWSEIKKFFNLSKEMQTESELFIFVLLNMNNSESNKLIEVPADYQIFSLRELQFNIPDNTLLVPKHELISDDEVIQDILNRYQVKRNQLPLILHTDKMAKYINAKSGNLVKIIRNSPTSGEYIVYRCVV